MAILASQALQRENKKNLMLSSLSCWCMRYLEDQRSSYGDALLVLTKWSESKIEDNLRTSQVADASIVKKQEH